MPSAVQIRARRRKPQINIVPLVDVLIVLIFFFLVSMQFRDRNVLNITPPEVETAGTNQAVQQIEISIDDNGTFFFNGEEMTVEELEASLRIAGATVDREIQVLIVADEDSALKYWTRAYDLARKYGLENIRLQSR